MCKREIVVIAVSFSDVISPGLWLWQKESCPSPPFFPPNKCPSSIWGVVIGFQVNISDDGTIGLFVSPLTSDVRTSTATVNVTTSVPRLVSATTTTTASCKVVELPQSIDSVFPYLNLSSMTEPTSIIKKPKSTSINTKAKPTSTITRPPHTTPNVESNLISSFKSFSDNLMSHLENELCTKVIPHLEQIDCGLNNIITFTKTHLDFFKGVVDMSPYSSDAAHIRERMCLLTGIQVRLDSTNEVLNHLLELTKHK